MKETNSIQFNNTVPFNLLSEEECKNLIEESKIVTYTIGQPISSGSNIQNSVIFLLSGEVRLLAKSDSGLKTITKLGPGNMIGLASILRAEGCEEISASSEIKALSIPDFKILELYENEIKFRNWCDESLFPSEIVEIIYQLIQQSPRSDINIKTVFFNILKVLKIIPFRQISEFNEIKNNIYLAGSSNINGKKIGEKIENISEINGRGPIAPRIISIPMNIYNQFFEKEAQNKTQSSNENKNTLNQTQDSNENIDQKNLNNEPNRTDLSSFSNINLGQDIKQNKFRLIRAKGPLTETIACLQMLCNSMEIPFRKDSVEKIIRDSISKGIPPSMDLCGGITAGLGLHTSGATVSAQMGTRIQCPSLIKWKEGFAVAKESNSDGLTIASPKEGLLRLKAEELENLFPEGISILLVERTNASPNINFGISWFWPSIKKYQGVLLQVLLASFIVQLFGLANPLLIQVIIDKVISQRSLDTLQILGIALIVVTILGGILGSLRTFLFAETTNRIDTRLGAEVIDHLLRLPLNYFDKRPVGELSSRIAELEKIRNFLTGQALTTILDGVFSLIYIVVMVIYSWLLTLIALIVLPIQVGLTLLGTPLIRRQLRNVAIENAKTQSHLVEVMTGIQTVKAQNVETISRWKWQEIYNKYISRTFERTITTTSLNELSQVLQQISQLLVLWVGASLVLKGELTLGQLIAFRIISSYVTQPLLRLSNIWQNIQELRVSFERLADIVDTPEESIESDKNNIPLPTIKGEIIFNDVNFSFSRNQQNILKNINLKIPQGKFVGIVGQSGSGKSTLMKLLPRLYEVKEGKILIDNYDVNKVELYSLRRQIGIVPQDPLLFAGTVSENISLTNPNCGSNEIVEVAKISGAHDFIMQLPMGYSTQVGERGSGLSGGQKQRIAIARTLLSKPNLLIMDEATSALDYSTERIVCENLKNACKGSTVFFITHRLSTIKNADIIVMLDQGVIAEVGSHTDLLDRKGRYYALYRQQEGG